MERSAIRVSLLRGETFPDFAALHPGYELSLRAQRSNPESFRSDSLDCFAALAM